MGDSMSRVVAVLWLLLASVLIGGSVGLAARASADPTGYTIANAGRICASLDEHPTFSGVTGVMAAVITDGGFSVEDAATVVVEAVWNLCPRHKNLLLAYGDDGNRRRI